MIMIKTMNKISKKFDIINNFEVLRSSFADTAAVELSEGGVSVNASLKHFLTP